MRYAMTNNVNQFINFDEGTMNFIGTTTSGREFNITTYLDDAREWFNGGLIQNCFPYLTANEREILMTGMDDEIWDAIHDHNYDDHDDFYDDSMDGDHDSAMTSAGMGTDEDYGHYDDGDY